jgi:thioredoxin 1
MPVVAITEKNFDEMLGRREETALLEFSAEYCIPCRKVAEIVSGISGERPDLLVGTVDLEEQPELAVRLGVMSIPAVVAMRRGEIVGAIEGLCSKEQVEGLLK